MLEPARITVHRADDARIGAAPGALGDPHRVLEFTIRLAVALEIHQAADQRIEDRQLPGIQQTVEIAAQIERALQGEARILILPGGVVGCTEPLQRAQQQTVSAAAAGVGGDFHAAQIGILGILVIAHAVLGGAEIGEGIDQLAIVGAVLLLGKRHELLGQRQRVRVAVRIERGTVLPVQRHPLGIGHGERRGRRQHRRSQHQGQLQGSHRVRPPSAHDAP